jgi:hypothetical protein
VAEQARAYANPNGPGAGTEAILLLVTRSMSVLTRSRIRRPLDRAALKETTR